jgi:8-oxo-dGTP pyrophosphatase MutT (NUDIX family)
MSVTDGTVAVRWLQGDDSVTTLSYLATLKAKTEDLLLDRKVSQAGALCFRPTEEGTAEVLLLTSRETGRWVIPKGSIEKNEKPHKCALREALEEAGIQGKVDKRPFGHYTYIKDPKKPPLIVSVFLLKWESDADIFREKGQRQCQWMSPSQAACLVNEPELKGLFRLFTAKTPRL